LGLDRGLDKEDTAAGTDLDRAAGKDPDKDTVVDKESGVVVVD
jgi:hypothetical protein